MGIYSLDEFVNKTSQQEKGEGLFELENPYLLEVNLNGTIWSKAGAMVAYRGNVKFTREGILEHGAAKMFKKFLTGEGARLMKAEGKGAVYLADKFKTISVINLENQSICVNGNDVLAFEPSIKWDIKLIKRIAGMLSGGLFNMHLSGKGMIAITSYFDPVTLKVTPGNPVITDPNATIAWSSNLQPELKTDISLKTFFGRGSGESFQMQFSGEGFVVIQPFEEVYYTSRS